MAEESKTVAASGTMTPEQVDQWFIDNFQNGPVAQNTEAYNQAYKAKEALKKLLAK